MAIRIRPQIVRKGSRYESFRITIPRAIIEAHNLRDRDFSLEVKRGKIILSPTKKV